MAKKAGALCRVVRTSDWKPRPEDVVRSVRVVQDTSHHYSRGMELDDVSDAWSHVSRPTDSRIDNTASREILDTVSTPISTIVEPITPSPRASARVQSSRVPSHVLHLDNLFGDEMHEPYRHTFTLKGRKVHGICRLPYGFALAPVPSTATVAELGYIQSNHGEPRINTPNKTTTEISSSYNLPQGLVAVFQTLYASVTLYRARGDQIARYGYASFGLTVAPYLVMSIVNLVGTVLTPNYATTFMVESEIMREAARRDGARFSGVVGILENGPSLPGTIDMVFEIDEKGRYFAQQERSNSPIAAYTNALTGIEESMEVSRQRLLIDLYPSDHDRTLKPNVIVPMVDYSSFSDRDRSDINLLLSLLVGSISLAINGILTRFKAGKSTRAQRVWTMTWLVFGILLGSGIQQVAAEARKNRILRILAMMVVYGSVAVGGLVVVCQMLLDYGSCVQMY
ncbi:MAG: hypothetical protein Q9195_008355 [Heterodermia aff. obscurata]